MSLPIIFGNGTEHTIPPIPEPGPLRFDNNIVTFDSTMHTFDEDE